MYLDENALFKSPCAPVSAEALASMINNDRTQI